MKNNEDSRKTYLDADELSKVDLILIKGPERKRWNKLVDKHHSLSSRLVGNQLRYVAEINGKWMALLSVGEASMHLEDRDAHIGWTDVQRGRRLRLIGNNTRFVILGKRTNCPDLASRVLNLLHRRVSMDYEMYF